MARYDGQNNSPGAPGNGGALAQRVYGQIERGQYNRPGPRGAGIVQPEVFMAPYPGTKEFFPLGNPAAGYRFEAARPGQGVRLAQASPGDIGNVAGMQAASDATQGYFPGPMMQMGPTEQQMKQQEILAARNAQKSAILESPVNYKKPFNVDINATSQGLESIGAGGTIVLDPNQRLKMGGTYTPGYTEEGVPISQGYKIEAGYETPGFGLNVNYRDSRGRMGGGGFGGQMNLKGTW